jgi:hypothetical protein
MVLLYIVDEFLLNESCWSLRACCVAIQTGMGGIRSVYVKVAIYLGFAS